MEPKSLSLWENKESEFPDVKDDLRVPRFESEIKNL